jgi:hypothetical protein
MSMVMIRCPKSGREVPTGIRMERTTFDCLPVFFAETYCPHCRTSHEWFARQAWVRESICDLPARAA